MRSLIGYILLSGCIYLASQLHSQQPTDQLRLQVLDVGQGDAIYLRLPSHDDVLIDAGPDDRILAQLGRAMTFGDRTIELLVISHNHADHIGGLTAVLGEYRVERIWLSGAIHTTDQYLELLKAVKAKQIPATIVKAGDKTTSGETELLVFHPPQAMTGQQPEDQHDATVVLKLNYRQFCAWLTGDINTNHGHHEETIIETAKLLGLSTECPVLKVTHHGSASGSTTAWLKAVKPTIATISSGRRNPYGHPAASTLRRLRETGATIYRTDEQGTVTVTTNGHDIWTKTEH